MRRPEPISELRPWCTHVAQRIERSRPEGRGEAEAAPRKEAGQKERLTDRPVAPPTALPLYFSLLYNYPNC